MYSIDLVIPTFNGLSLLKKHLPAVIKNCPQVNNFIIVDNASNDGTDLYLKNLSSKIRIIKNQTNLGFTVAINQGVSASNAEFVVLLNNDVHPISNFIKSTLSHFKNESVFAVTFNEINSNFPLVSWKSGKFQFEESKNKDRAALSAWASGGSAIFRKKIWDQLDGFNPIYSPGYWEDIDLGWRAYKLGYKIIWEPASKVEHQHESTFSKLSKNYVDILKQRNELLFIWQNFSDPVLLMDHFKFLLVHTLTHPGYIKVIFSALLEIFKLRFLGRSRLKDREVLNILSNPYNLQ